MLRNKYRLFLILLNGQTKANAVNKRYWTERYHIRFQKYLQRAMHHKFLRVSVDPMDKLLNLPTSHLKEFARSFGIEVDNQDAGQLRLSIFKMYQQHQQQHDLSPALQAWFDGEVYLLTPKGSDYVASAQHLWFMHHFYYPDVVDLKHLLPLYKRQPALLAWQYVAELLDRGIQAAQAQGNVTVALILQKRKVRLYRQVACYPEGLACLQQVLFNELEHHVVPNVLARNAKGYLPAIKHLSRYEIQELHFFLVQLNLSLDEFLMGLSHFLQSQDMKHNVMTRMEMMRAVMLAYLEDFNGLAQLYDHVQARQESPQLMS